MARGDRVDTAKGFVWVDMKDSKGNIVKDGKGNAVKTRKFVVDKPAASTSVATKAAAKAPAAKPAMSTKSAPKAAAQSGAAQSGVAGKVKPKPSTMRATASGSSYGASGDSASAKAPVFMKPTGEKAKAVLEERWAKGPSASNLNFTDWKAHYAGKQFKPGEAMSMYKAYQNRGYAKGGMVTKKGKC